jgi:hypothetical protein
MSLLNEVANAISQYDTLLKILGAVAAPGGIWFWIDKYRNRIRIKVRNFELARIDQSGRGVSFELENVGTAITSLEPSFSVSLCTRKRERVTCTYRIDGDARRLAPHELVRVIGWHNHPESNVVLFGWYMNFKLPLTRGGNIHVYIRNAEFKQISPIKFYWERLRFMMFGKLPE